MASQPKPSGAPWGKSGSPRKRTPKQDATLVQAIVEDTNLERKQVETVLGAIGPAVAKVLRKQEKLKINGLVKVRRQRKPATKGGLQTYFGKQVETKAKPESTAVKMSPDVVLKRVLSDHKLQ